MPPGGVFFRHLPVLIPVSYTHLDVYKRQPVELFESMGVSMERIEPDVTSFSQADTRMHPNICSFVKGVLEEVIRSDYEGVILTTCCDSIRRLFDVLKEEYPDKFIYILDIPRITKDAGIALYRQRIEAMVNAYETFSGKKFNPGRFQEYLKKKKSGQKKEEQKKNCLLYTSRCV